MVWEREGEGMTSEDKMWLVVVVTCLILLTVAAIAVPVTLVALDSTTRDELPRCHEEQLLEGFGRFGDGQWDHYTCVEREEVKA
jgi:hypothetical protein